MLRQTLSQPWSLLGQFQNEMGRHYSPVGVNQRQEESMLATEWLPSVDVKEEVERFIISADIPGVDPKDIEVTMEKGMLTIKGSRKHEAAESKEGYKRIETKYGSFMRRFNLPESADPEGITAHGSNGVLTVSIPKVVGVKARKIAVDC